MPNLSNLAVDVEETFLLDDSQVEGEQSAWYVMCDRKRRNALTPAYKMLQLLGIEAFTPLIKRLVGKGDKKEVVEIPFISDLLFVHSTKKELAPILASTPTLHYRFKKGGKYREHLIVRNDDMLRFIYAVEHAELKEFFAIEALPTKLIGNTVVIHGGPLDGYKAILRKMQGSKKKRVFIELHNMAYGEFELTNFTSLQIINP